MSTKDYANQPTTSEDKIPLLQKIGYSLGTFHDMWGHWLYLSLVSLVFNIYLNVSPAWIGRVLLVKLVYEAFWDSLFGWWSDNTRTRMGRRRPFILVGAFCSGIALPLMFCAGTGWSESGYVIFMMVSLAVFVPIMSCFYMPYQSLGAEMTPDYNERTSLGAFRSAMQKIPELAMFAAATFATAGVWVNATWSEAPSRLGVLFNQSTTWFGQVGSALANLDFPRLGVLLQTVFGWAPPPEGTKANVLLGAQVYLTVLGAIMVVAAIGLFFLIRERYYDKLVVGRNQGSISIKETLWQTLACKPFRANLSMALAYGIGTSIVGTFGFYATVYYVCHGNIAVASGWNTYMGIGGMVFGFLGIPTYAFVAKRFGKKKGMIVVQISAIVVFISTWWLYDPEHPLLQLFASGLIAFTSAGFWMIYGSMTADVIDYDELENGKRREGAFSACGSYIMKFGMGIGGWAASEVLAKTGFDAALGGNQTPHALFMIRILLAGVPLTGLIIALILLIRFPLTPEKMGEIREKLEARRGMV